ncbi:hypothetical protein QTP88_026079 [Uroleucon formosanum]
MFSKNYLYWIYLQLNLNSVPTTVLEGRNQKDTIFNYDQSIYFFSKSNLELDLIYNIPFDTSTLILYRFVQGLI